MKEQSEFEKIQTIIKYHLAEIAKCIDPTPYLTLVVRNGHPGSDFLVSTEEGVGVRAALVSALEVFDEGGPA